LNEQVAALRHRGPDHNAAETYEVLGRKIGFGHTRLSIVDLTAEAHQPFHSADGQYSIIYNGEIYNHRKLRDQLESQGVHFRTNSDTEVLLALYARSGQAALKQLDGIFAFAILDRLRGVLFCARDHLGIKPFYYHADLEQGHFYFASEIKALFKFDSVPKRIAAEGLTEFLFNGWVYEPDCGLEGIKKIPPGYCLAIDLASQALEVSAYYNAAHSQPPESAVQQLIDEAIETQALSEVPIALFFSGGVDSTVIAAQLRNRMTSLTVRYAGSEMAVAGLQDDFAFGSRIAALLGLDLQIEEVEVKQKTAVDILEQIRGICRGIEEPISDFTYYPAYLLSKCARAAGNKVILSGMGADEVFLGYPRYLAVRYRSLLRWLTPIITLSRPVLRKLPSLSKKIDCLISFARSKDFAVGYSHLIGYFSSQEIKALVKQPETIDAYRRKTCELLKPAENLDDTKKAMYLDLYGFLTHNFIVSDKASMANSIEMRVPLVTKDILSKNIHEPTRRLMGLACLKKVLKEMLKKVLPRSLVYRRKTGFNPPLDGLIQSLGKDRLRTILLDGDISRYLHTAPIADLVDMHFAGQANHTYKLWQLLFLHYWIEFIQEQM